MILLDSGALSRRSHSVPGPGRTSNAIHGPKTKYLTLVTIAALVTTLGLLLVPLLLRLLGRSRILTTTIATLLLVRLSHARASITAWSLRVTSLSRVWNLRRHLASRSTILRVPVTTGSGGRVCRVGNCTWRIALVPATRLALLLWRTFLAPGALQRSTVDIITI